MIGVLLTFRYTDDFDENAVRRIADKAQARFRGMAGLRSKAFTVNPSKREVVNFYIWEAEDAARAFFTDAQLNRIADHYKVCPSLDFVQVVALVNNHMESR